MKMQQHGQYLFQLTRLGAFNSFLVRDEDGLIPVPKNSVTLTEFFRAERVRPSAGSGNWRNTR